MNEQYITIKTNTTIIEVQGKDYTVCINFNTVLSFYHDTAQRTFVVTFSNPDGNINRNKYTEVTDFKIYNV